MYERRDYRQSFDKELYWFQVSIGETDLLIGAESDLETKAVKTVRQLRNQVHQCIKQYPNFRSSLLPLDISVDPLMIKQMLAAAKMAKTGPMAAVAGAISMYVAQSLHPYSNEVFVENGGDLYIYSNKNRTIGIYAGKSPLSDRLAIHIKKEQFPLAVCTSSATVGHSYSKGKADAVTILSKDGALSDAVATKVCNEIQTAKDLQRTLDQAMTIKGIVGAVAVINDKIGAVGQIELVPWHKSEE